MKDNEAAYTIDLRNKKPLVLNQELDYDDDEDISQFGDLLKFKFPKNDKNDPQYF